MSASWNAYGTVTFAVGLLFAGAESAIELLCAPLGFIGSLAASDLMAIPVTWLGQGYGLLQVCDAIPVEMKASGGDYNDGTMKEIPLAHLLRAIPPPQRLLSFFMQASLTSAGSAVGFVPLGLLLTVDDQLRSLDVVVAMAYSQFLYTRLGLAGGFPPWWKDGPPQGALPLGAGLAVLGDRELEGPFLTLIDSLLKFFPPGNPDPDNPENLFPTKSDQTTANPHEDGPPGTWEDGNAALDLLVGLALGWQHQKRHGAGPGFPAAPDMTTLDTPALTPKPPVPPPACPPPIWARTGSNTLTVPGNGTVVDTGLDVAPWDRVTVESSGLVTLGTGGAAGPAGAGQAIWDRAYPYWGSNALAGQLLGRLGPYGVCVPLGDMFQRVYAAPVPFPVGALYPELATKRLYLLVNVPPSSPASGTFTAVVTREAAAPPAPVVTELSPATGSALGGDRIEVYGTHLQTTRQVSFGGVPAEHFTVYDDTHLWATPPAGSGQVEVSVITAGGTATAGFTYIVGLPVVESVTPSSGPNTGDTPVTISGRGLDQIDNASFGVWSEPAEPQSASSATTSSAPGAGVVHVQVSGGPSGPSQTSANDLFSYLGPVILSLDPSEGDEAGGTLVTIHGTGLSGATSVTFGGSPATDLVCVSDTVLTVRSPSGAGRPDVLVTALGVTSLPSMLPSQADLYFYDGPGLESVSPSSGPDTGNTTVTISGTMLDHVQTVFFDEVAVPFALVSPTSLTAVGPPFRHRRRDHLRPLPVRIDDERTELRLPSDPDDHRHLSCLGSPGRPDHGHDQRPRPHGRHLPGVHQHLVRRLDRFHLVLHRHPDHRRNAGRRGPGSHSR